MITRKKIKKWLGYPFFFLLIIFGLLAFYATYLESQLHNSWETEYQTPYNTYSEFKYAHFLGYGRALLKRLNLDSENLLLYKFLTSQHQILIKRVDSKILKGDGEEAFHRWFYTLPDWVEAKELSLKNRSIFVDDEIKNLEDLSNSHFANHWIGEFWRYDLVAKKTEFIVYAQKKGVVSLTKQQAARIAKVLIHLINHIDIESFTYSAFLGKSTLASDSAESKYIPYKLVNSLGFLSKNIYLRKRVCIETPQEILLNAVGKAQQIEFFTQQQIESGGDKKLSFVLRENIQSSVRYISKAYLNCAE